MKRGRFLRLLLEGGTGGTGGGGGNTTFNTTTKRPTTTSNNSTNGRHHRHRRRRHYLLLHYLKLISFIFVGIYIFLFFAAHNYLDIGTTSYHWSTTTTTTTTGIDNNHNQYHYSSVLLMDGHFPLSYDNTTTTTTTTFNTSYEPKPLWEYSNIIPKWMKEYFYWHKEQYELLLSNSNPNNDKSSIRYYLVECTARYQHCGGTADRLGPLPFHVYHAAISKRLLLIHWTKPCKLEEFLVPPMGSIDWRVPDWLYHNMFQNYLHTGRSRIATNERQIQKFIMYEKAIVVHVKFQSHNHGQVTYDKILQKQATATAATNIQLLSSLYSKEKKKD